MIRLSRPDERTVREALARAAKSDLTYRSPGMTRNPPAPGWPVNRIRASLGTGPGIWERATAALRRWEQYRTRWTTLTPPAPPLEPGATFAVVARHHGLWSVNCCRVVYAPSEAEAAGVYACAIGTLGVHSESGEERFAVEQDADGTVWFELLAYARARHPLARLAPPIVTRVQRRFAQDAAAAMRRAVA